MLAFDLVGGWTSSLLFLRLLTIVEGPWEPLRAGFTHKDTKERAQLTMGPPSPELALAFAAGNDPFGPSLDEALLDEIETHKAVVSVRSATDAGPPLERARTVVRATNAALNAGATAVRCRTSGLAHSAEAFQLLAAAVDAAGPDELAEALVAAYVLHTPTGTRGMHALGVPDLTIAPSGSVDRDLARLRAAAVGVVRGTTKVEAAPDTRGLPAPMVNPHGVGVVR